MISNLKQHKKLLFIILSFVFCEGINAQTFGFGCLGLSGFYGGYSQMQYSVDGINNYLKANYFGPIPSTFIEFKKGSGYRVGANLFRAKFDYLFFSAKGFYQFMKENYQSSETVQNGIIKNSFNLSMNHWGIALDIGIPFFSLIDIKLVEGGIIFSDFEFTHEVFQGETQVYNRKFEQGKNKFSYYVGTGLILHLIPDYISVEGTASYSFLKIDNIIIKDPGVSSGPIAISNPISKGGFYATVQLNIGFPL